MDADKASAGEERHVPGKCQERLAFEERRSLYWWAFVAFNMSGFSLARVGLAVPAGLKALLPPGEYYHQREHQAEFSVHVVSTFLWSFLGIVQFVPRVRRVALGYHRWAGRVYFACCAVLCTSGLLLAPNAFGGQAGALLATAVLFVVFVATATMGFLRIRQGRVEEHRAWMLRNFASGSSVLWSRTVVPLGGLLLTRLQGFWGVMECGQVLYELNGDGARLLELFPLCATEQHVPVPTSGGRSIVNHIVGMRMCFAAGLWLGLIINMAGVELWIRRARAECLP